MNHFTKTAIIESFVCLLNRQPLDKITVKDIVDDCGVNRSTFYYYFQDIYALLDEVFSIEVEKTIDLTTDCKSLTDCIINSIEFALQNKKAIYHVYNSLSRENLEKYLYQVVGNMITKIIKEKTVGLEVMDSDIELITDLYKYALVGLILKWLERGMKDDPTIVIKRLEFLIDGNIRHILEKASEQR